MIYYNDKCDKLHVWLREVGEIILTIIRLQYLIGVFCLKTFIKKSCTCKICIQFSLCRQRRSRDYKTPVLNLTTM